MIKHFKTLLRGEVDALSLEKPGWRWFATYCLAIAVGSSVYGATIGLWRAPLQSVFTAIKFPLLIFLTCIGNGDPRPQYDVADACLCHCLCRDYCKSAVARLAAKNDPARHHRPCRSI